MKKSIIALNALNCLKLQHNSLFHVSRQKAKWLKAFFPNSVSHFFWDTLYVTVHLCICVYVFVHLWVCTVYVSAFVCVGTITDGWWWWQDTGWCHPCPRWQRFTPWNIPDSPSFCLFPGSPASFDQCTFSPPFCKPIFASLSPDNQLNTNADIKRNPTYYFSKHTQNRRTNLSWQCF